MPEKPGCWNVDPGRAGSGDLGGCHRNPGKECWLTLRQWLQGREEVDGLKRCWSPLFTRMRASLKLLLLPISSSCSAGRKMSLWFHVAGIVVMVSDPVFPLATLTCPLGSKGGFCSAVLPPCSHYHMWAISTEYTNFPVWTSTLCTLVKVFCSSVHINLSLYTLAIHRHKLCIYSAPKSK